MARRSIGRILAPLLLVLGATVVVLAVTASEPFTGTGALSANWTHQTANHITRVSDQGFGTTNPGEFDCAFYSGASWAANHSSQVKIIANLSTPSGDGAGVSVNNSTDTGDAAWDGYLLFTDGMGGANHFYLAEVVNGGGFDQIGQYSEAVVVNDTIKLERNGSTLKAYLNGGEITCDSGSSCSGGVVTDTTLTGGSPGMCVFDDTGLDDWAGADVAVASCRGLSLLGVGC